MPGQARLLGTGRQLQRHQARLDGRHRRLPERRRHLHRLHHAGFPDKFMPFMDEPPGAHLSSTAIGIYGRLIKALRRFTNKTANKEPKWRHRGAKADHRLQADNLRPSKSRLRDADFHRSTASMKGHPTWRHRHQARIRDRKRRNLVEMSWDPDHPDRRQPGHLHQDRFRQPRGRRVPQHLVDLPRLQHLHEGQGPARRALHHQPHLRHLRRQPRHLLVYAQNMAFGIRPPAMAEWIINLGEAAEYMFDHNIFQDNLVGVDFCEQMVKETNPGVLQKAENTNVAARRHARLPDHRRHHAVAQPVHRRVLPRGAADEPHDARDVLPDGRPARPSRRRSIRAASAPCPSLQLFTDYLVRLMKYVEFMKKVVPLHDDLFDFFYEALPGYEEVGRRRVLLGCWGSFNDPTSATTVSQHGRVGQGDVRHAGRRRRRRTGHHQPRRYQPRHPHSAGQLVLRRLGGDGRDVRS